MALSMRTHGLLERRFPATVIPPLAQKGFVVGGPVVHSRIFGLCFPMVPAWGCHGGLCGFLVVSWACRTVAKLSCSVRLVHVVERSKKKMRAKIRNIFCADAQSLTSGYVRPALGFVDWWGYTREEPRSGG